MKVSSLLSNLTLLFLLSTSTAAKPPLTPEPKPRLDRRARDSRLGSNFSTIPIWRTFGGTNVVNIGVGGDGPGFSTQPMNLTLSTSINYLLVSTIECSGCVDGGLAYDPSLSTTLTPTPLALQYTYPSTTLQYDSSSISSLLNISGQIARDTVNDGRRDVEQRTVVLVDEFLDARGTVVDDFGVGSGFNPDTEGFYGLGIDLATPMNSLIPQVLASSNPPQEGLVVGIDMLPYSLDVTEQAGVIHWGAVPEGSYRGGWNWIRPTGSLSSVWATRLNKLEINGRDIGTSGFRATIDPSQYTIIVPEATAISIYSRVDGAIRDRVTTSRWNVPCDASIDFSIHLPGGNYKANSTDLVQHRSVRSCWGGIVAWPSGSAMDRQGEVLLGTPFLSNVYTALYYSPDERYVGLAAKPGVGGSVVKPIGNRLSSGAIAGIIFALIAVMLIALGLLFSRSRDSMAGYYSRVIRKQHKLATTQMMHQYPGMEPPPLIMQAQPVFSEPRHMDALYARPFIPGQKGYEREMALGMDPLAGMGMYGQQQHQYSVESDSNRGSGFWGGWRRAKEESQWRNQQGRPGQMVQHAGAGASGYGEYHSGQEQVQPYPYPYPNPYEGGDPNQHPAQGHMTTTDTISIVPREELLSADIPVITITTIITRTILMLTVVAAI
ncbi:hypothetical protein FFLO_03156 [Filobasidium floriforme]|uniref:Peptidase A1 domain-containing protein n=1 Tax=Filobasidium floriforme TaxID=5210 RepID=A0A8K0NTD9_9TREE|nr:hypothetical protein FFLO_03156 [Filobasidium floriforme]